MIPPRIFAGRRRGLLARLALLVVVQAVALAGAAVATRAAFGALHAGAGLDPPVLAGFVVAGLIAAWAQFRLTILAERMSQDYAGDVRSALFEHASRSRQSDLERRRFGYHLLRFTGDLSALGNWPGRGLPRMAQAAVLLPASALVLYWLHPAFGFVGLGLIAGIACVTAPALPGLFRAHATLRKARARLAADMSERILVAPQLAAFGRRQAELAHLSARVGDVAAAAEGRRRSASLLRLAPEAATAIAGCLVLWLGSSGDVPAAAIAAALAALALIVRPLGNLASALNQAAAFRAAHRSLAKALARPVVGAESGSKRMTARKVRLTIGRSDGPPIQVAAGEKICLPRPVFGRLVKVLSGVEPADTLTVRLNGDDIRDLSPGSLRRAVCVVTDAPLILKGSLRKNLTLALRKRPPDARILSLIAAAGLAHALDRLGGLDRSFAERGAELGPEDRITLCLLRVAVQRPALVLFQDTELRRPAPVMNGRHTVICQSLKDQDFACDSCRHGDFSSAGCVAPDGT